MKLWPFSKSDRSAERSSTEQPTVQAGSALANLFRGKRAAAVAEAEALNHQDNYPQEGTSQEPEFELMPEMAEVQPYPSETELRQYEVPQGASLSESETDAVLADLYPSPALDPEKTDLNQFMAQNSLNFVSQTTSQPDTPTAATSYAETEPYATQPYTIPEPQAERYGQAATGQYPEQTYNAQEIEQVLGTLPETYAETDTPYSADSLFFPTELLTYTPSESEGLPYEAPVGETATAYTAPASVTPPEYELAPPAMESNDAYPTGNQAPDTGYSNPAYLQPFDAEGAITARPDYQAHAYEASSPAPYATPTKPESYYPAYETPAYPEAVSPTGYTGPGAPEADYPAYEMSVDSETGYAGEYASPDNKSHSNTPDAYPVAETTSYSGYGDTADSAYDLETESSAFAATDYTQYDPYPETSAPDTADYELPSYEANDWSDFNLAPPRFDQGMPDPASYTPGDYHPEATLQQPNTSVQYDMPGYDTSDYNGKLAQADTARSTYGSAEDDHGTSNPTPYADGSEPSHPEYTYYGEESANMLNAIRADYDEMPESYQDAWPTDKPDEPYAPQAGYTDPTPAYPTSEAFKPTPLALHDALPLFDALNNSSPAPAQPVYNQAVPEPEAYPAEQPTGYADPYAATATPEYAYNDPAEYTGYPETQPEQAGYYENPVKPEYRQPPTQPVTYTEPTPNDQAPEYPLYPPPVAGTPAEPNATVHPQPATRNTVPTPQKPRSKPVDNYFSITESLENFEAQTLLRESRFMKESIDRLVDAYFGQEDPPQGAAS